MADIAAVLPVLVKSQVAFPAFDKRGTALRRAIDALKVFASEETDALKPAAAHRIGQAAQSGQGLQGHNMMPPGMQLAGPAPMGGGGMAPGGPGGTG